MRDEGRFVATKLDLAPSSAEEAIKRASKVSSYDAASMATAEAQARAQENAERVKEEELEKRIEEERLAAEANEKAKEASERIKSELKSLNDVQRRHANNMAVRNWYQRNRGKKQEYNKQYYEDNIAYWQARYLATRNKVGRGDAKISELLADQINVHRSLREMNEFNEAHSKTPFTELWSIGARPYIDAGKKFLRDLMEKHLDKLQEKIEKKHLSRFKAYDD